MKENIKKNTVSNIETSLKDLGKSGSLSVKWGLLHGR